MIRFSPHIELCPPGERAAALEVLYQRMPGSLRPRLIADVLSEVSSGQVDLSGLWIARQRSWGLTTSWAFSSDRIIGALLTQGLAGRAAAVWAPEVSSSLWRGATAAALVHTALADLQSRGFRIAQAVLDESASRLGALDLTRGGLPRITELLYLERDTKIPLPPPAQSSENLADPLPQLQWRSFNPAHEAEFRTILQATYASSLDMPELEGVRSLDDVIEGHRATGRFVPERWRLGQVPGEPAAAVVLLLAEVPDRDVWEVVYLGLTEAARGRGLGRAAIQQALDLARPHVSRLELAVDLRNHPATRLYEAAGFVPFDRRSVHLAVFPESTS
jgi:GNAT superfamily N-acetyltransferase